jgi:Dolichyl-phosphate-mannose-protein mannosyltransferase
VSYNFRVERSITLPHAPLVNPLNGRCSTIIEIAAVTTICLAFAALVIGFARNSSATFDETVRLPAGLSYVRWHDYRLNTDHPPLLKKLIAIPFLSEKVWPLEIDAKEANSTASADWRTLPNSRSVLENAWVTASVDYSKQWVFGHALLYGVRDESLARLRQLNSAIEGPYTAPTTGELSKADFYNDPDKLLFRARMVVMVIGISLALFLYLWSRNLFGIPGGMLSILLFCFDPNVIANSGLATADIAVTFFIFAGVFFLWRICCRAGIGNTLLFLLSCAAAFATKFSAVALIAIFFLATSARIAAREVWPMSAETGISLDGLRRRIIAVGVLFLVTMLTVFGAMWSIYDFRYAAARPEFGATNLPIEQALYRDAAIKTELKRWHGLVPAEERGNLETRIAQIAQTRPLTFTGRLIMFANRYRLLPEAYLYGLAHASTDPLMRTSFLRGAYSNSGFNMSYLWAFLLKTPLTAMLAIIAALIVTAFRGFVRTWHFAFIASAIAIFCLAVSLFAPVNIAHRYLLPIYPFLYLLCGMLGAECSRLAALPRRCLAALGVLVIVISSQFVFSPLSHPQKVHPHYLAYFNEIFGGPRNGHENLVDSNLDWGQDLTGLKKWLDDRNITEPIWLSYFGNADPRWYGIRHISVPKVLGGYLFESSPYLASEDSGAPDKAVRDFLNDLKPGQYLVVSATNLAAIYLGPQARDVWQHLLASCTYADQVGYSLFIYRVGPEQ